MASEIFEDIWKIMKEIEFVTKSELTNDLICSICKKLMVKATQSKCGCRYCSLCIESYLGGSKKFCPGKISKYCQIKLLNFEEDIIVDNAVNVRISEVIVKCPRKNCEFQDELSAIEIHMRTCDKNPISCPYFEFGCIKSEVLNNEINEHLYADSFHHNKLLVDFINNLRNEIESMKNGMIELKTENRLSHDFRIQTENLNRNETTNNSEIGKLNQRIDSLSNENISLKIEIERISQSIIDIKKSMNTSDSTKSYPIRDDEMKFESVNNLCSAIPITSLNIYEESELESENVSGNFNWKIDELSQQPPDSWRYSRPFYSHRFGYKMCLSLKFCNNTVNAYFHLLRGENDDQLTWPFNYTVTISVIDQPGGLIYSSRTIKYEFCPKNNAWIRPITERNSEIWCFTFLEETLKNDKLRFKCKVNC